MATQRGYFDREPIAAAWFDPSSATQPAQFDLTLIDAGGGTLLFQAVAGTLTSSGTLLKQALVPLAGTLASVGGLAKPVQRALAGAMTSSGALLKQAQKVAAGTLTSSATLAAIKIVLKSLAGTLTSSGALVKMAGRTMTGALTSGGGLSKLATHLFAGTLSFLGVVTGTVPIAPPPSPNFDRFLAWAQLRVGFHRERR